MSIDITQLKSIFAELFPNIDEETCDYLSNMILDNINDSMNDDMIKESLAPFLESYGLVASDVEANQKCEELCQRFRLFRSSNQSSSSSSSSSSSFDDTPKLLDKIMKLSTVVESTFNESEQAAIDSLWGFDNIRNKKNDTIELTESGSAKFERKLAKDQKKWLAELESKFVGEEETLEISTMMLPDYTSKCRDRDIQCNNITITYGGHILLEGADLRFAYGRRYGLIGRNGIGKTTLLKHIANYDIEGFPRHHRVLHVKQEVKSSDQSVLAVVLESDVERTELIRKFQNIVARQEALSEQVDSASSSAEMEAMMEEMAEVQDRMEHIGVDSAEARAASILSGLQFTESMQASSTSSLSGGWLMRVSLACALYIEPDVLMLDEPTNHLDLEAVIWLQTYLLQYPHTVIVVSHDRAFLNEVCTDIILFNNLKLQYYRGNYDAFEATREEMLLVQQRQHEAQSVKLAHMQEFVDKFRYNAKRASLVQSRIKAISKETVIEAVEDESEFSFEFFDAGDLGRNVIQIEGVTFGYPQTEAAPAPASASTSSVASPERPLFTDVHLNIDQTSRVSLVGPNGAGKSTLLNLIRGTLKPTEGIVHVNPQLRLGVFTQHHLDSFDLNMSPVQNMLKRWPKAKEDELRAHLGRFEITGNDAIKPMKFSSGGQKSRVAFACLTYLKPHVLLLDEPTNHLDMNAIEALIRALRGFKGGVMVISHDQHFITSVCNELWVVGGNKVIQFRGTFADYKALAVRRALKRIQGQTKAAAK